VAPETMMDTDDKYQQPSPGDNQGNQEKKMIENMVPAINALEKMQHDYCQFRILDFLLAHFENIESENTNDNCCQPFSSKAFKTKVTDCRIPTTKIIQDDSVGYIHGLGIMQHDYRHLKIAECSRGQVIKR
jgi:hypothetical protein